jgi:photosystem II stability/assembly factor-like uncharacterized protein
LRDIYFVDEKTGWLLCERSIYELKTNDEPRTYLMRTTDGGATWTRVNVIGADVDVRLVGTIFINRGQKAWAFGEAGALYFTQDGGANWERQRLPTRKLLLGGQFIDATRGWLVGAGATILQTLDGGTTWRTGDVLFEQTDVRLTAVSFPDAHHGWAVGTEGHVLATNDGGHIWRAQNSNVVVDLSDVKFLNAREGWAVGAEGTIIHTTDGGVTWMREASDTDRPLERLYFINREHGWAVGYGGAIVNYTSRPASPPKLKTDTMR